eukprot:3016352-Rhodomonas_salina.1
MSSHAFPTRCPGIDVGCATTRPTWMRKTGSQAGPRCLSRRRKTGTWVDLSSYLRLPGALPGCVDSNRPFWSRVDEIGVLVAAGVRIDHANRGGEWPLYVAAKE